MRCTNRRQQGLYQYALPSFGHEKVKTENAKAKTENAVGLANAKDDIRPAAKKQAGYGPH